jgi:excisionase family DNA binding protein
MGIETEQEKPARLTRWDWDSMFARMQRESQAEIEALMHAGAKPRERKPDEPMAIDPDILILMQELDDPGRDALERVIHGAVEEARMPAKPQPAKPRKNPDDPMTMGEAAARIGCSVKTLRGHIASGALRYVVIGHGRKRPHKRIAPADLNAFIEAQTRKDVACLSIETRARPTGNSTSKSEVIAFSARRSARLGAKRKP